MSKLSDWWKRLLGRKTTATSPAPAPAPAPAKLPTFVDTFSSLDPAKWTVSTWSAPGRSASNVGKFAAANVHIRDGVLCLKLSQSVMNGVFTSIGGELCSTQKFGYGTYEFTMRASSTAGTSAAIGSPVSGSITGLFNYLPNSATEIDVEVEGNSRSPITQLTTWVSETAPNEHTNATPVGGLPHEGFHVYKWIWEPTQIRFYRDDVLLATHTKIVPFAQAPVMMNHWGTNSPDWGGIATPDIDRFMYVKRFAFTPL